MTARPGPSDVLVIGAGIVGVAVALACARAGLRVVIVERAQPAQGATAAAMGHVVAMGESPAQWALTRYGQRLWRSCALPLEAEYAEPGTLWIAAGSEEMAEAERKHRLFAAHGVSSRILTANELRAAEPGLRSGLHGALLVHEDGILAPPVASLAFLAEAQSLGALFVQGDVVRAGHGEVLLAGGTALRAQTIVLATGAALELLPTPGLVRKRKGHLVITRPSPPLVKCQLVELGYLKSAHAHEAPGHRAPGTDEGSVAFNVQPRSGGRLLVGSSRQFGDEADTVRPELLVRMLARATEYLPALATLPIERAWTGFRAATPDSLPLIGPCVALSGDASLYLATGHEGLGITTALATAELVVDTLLHRASAIPREPYLPDRLAAGAQ
jgi:glycine/D-amino acid oxidase-like deaminating enzyme